MKRTYFTTDDADCPVFEGWDDGKRRNGWLEPLVDQATLDAILQWYPAALTMLDAEHGNKGLFRVLGITFYLTADPDEE